MNQTSRLVTFSSFNLPPSGLIHFIHHPSSPILSSCLVWDTIDNIIDTTIKSLPLLLEVRTMERGNLSRRGFLANMLGGMTAAGLPIWFAKETVIDAQETKTARQPGANDRIVMGAIGTGTNRSRRAPNAAIRGERGIHIMQSAMSEDGVQVVGVCDVDRPNAEFAQNLVRTAARDAHAWPFRVNGRVKTIKVAGRIRTNGALAANEAAVQGLGIANAPLWQVQPLVDRGDAELLLTRFEPPPMPIHAVWPASRVLPARTHLFVEFLTKHLRQKPL